MPVVGLLGPQDPINLPPLVRHPNRLSLCPVLLQQSHGSTFTPMHLVRAKPQPRRIEDWSWGRGGHPAGCQWGKGGQIEGTEPSAIYFWCHIYFLHAFDVSRQRVVDALFA